jgi:hypothetical protein
MKFWQAQCFESFYIYEANEKGAVWKELEISRANIS